ncbi:hypothetical protein AAFF_G00425090 [Aldrovandia affinis]|uniref:Uncharacterized protein n=1 Tax=Aldrovandia affinis TaxID=143900 RepID=A0AAD7X126_9TELE|nr:hypothetical protein AAFF_G00425090 [Aldrovandia affinis]
MTNNSVNVQHSVAPKRGGLHLQLSDDLRAARLTRAKETLFWGTCRTGKDPSAPSANDTCFPAERVKSRGLWTGRLLPLHHAGLRVAGASPRGTTRSATRVVQSQGGPGVQ